jgi:hypothetical protein
MKTLLDYTALTTHSMERMPAGTCSTMAYQDLDNDGDLGCVLGGSSGAFPCFKNTGTATAPVFAESKLGGDNPFNGVALGLTLPSFSRISTGTWTTMPASRVWTPPARQHQSGTTTRTRVHRQPQLSLCLQPGGDNIFDVTAVTALRLIPTCFGADNDGDIDCMFGTSTGTAEHSEHIRNTGTNTAPAFTHATSTAPISPWDAVEHRNPLGTIDVGAYSAPTCFNIDAECTSLAHCSANGLCKHPSQCECLDGWGDRHQI